MLRASYFHDISKAAKFFEAISGKGYRSKLFVSIERGLDKATVVWGDYVTEKESYGRFLYSY
jgi:hypothetical protein